MAIETQLTQDQIDRLFPAGGQAGAADTMAQKAVAYDFRRADRIPKEQLRSIHLLHDFFARNLASSLGAYLRTYLTVTLVWVEQLSFAEFLGYLPTPTAIATLGLKPMEGNAILEMNPSLVFPFLDILLGGSGKNTLKEFREVTEIEQSILEGVLRIVLHDLTETWKQVADVTFGIDTLETQPQLIQILSPNEAIVAIGFEIAAGENRGMMNFGIPSIMVKMLGQKFEQQGAVRRKGPSTKDYGAIRGIVAAMPVMLDARLDGGTIRAEDLLQLEVGDVLTLDLPLSRPSHLQVNGKRKFQGEIVVAGRNRAMLVRRLESG